MDQEEPIKVVIMGMENAGKTTIIDVLTQKIKNPPHLHPPDMYPTKGVERRNLIEKNTIIWDFGGQELYRNEYLTEAESLLQSISFVYYIADVQDYYRLYSSMMYFKVVFPKILKYSPDAEVIFLFHKMDPKFDPNTKNLKEKFLENVESFLEVYEKPLEIYETTIFDLNSIKTAFKRVL